MRSIGSSLSLHRVRVVTRRHHRRVRLPRGVVVVGHHEFRDNSGVFFVIRALLEGSELQPTH